MESTTKAAGQTLPGRTHLNRADPSINGSLVNGFYSHEAAALIRYNRADSSLSDALEAQALVLSKVVPDLNFSSSSRRRRKAVLKRLIKDVFMAMHPELRRRLDLEQRTLLHADHPCLISAIDGAFESKDHLWLMEFDCSAIPYDPIFSSAKTVIHCNHNISASNGVHYDRALVVHLHAPEATLDALEQVCIKAEMFPGHYADWVRLLATSQNMGVAIEKHAVRIDPKTCALINDFVPAVWREAVIGGAAIPSHQIQNSNKSNAYNDAVSLFAKAREIQLANRASKAILNETAKKIEGLLERHEVGNEELVALAKMKLDSFSFDVAAAIQTLEAYSVPTSNYFVNHAKKESALDVESGNDNALREFVACESLVIGQLHSLGIDPKLFFHRRGCEARHATALSTDAVNNDLDSWKIGLEETVSHLASIQNHPEETPLQKPSLSIGL